LNENNKIDVFKYLFKLYLKIIIEVYKD